MNLMSISISFRSALDVTSQQRDAYDSCYVAIARLEDDRLEDRLEYRLEDRLDDGMICLGCLSSITCLCL
jgi:hypothetical protein